MKSAERVKRSLASEAMAMMDMSGVAYIREVEHEDSKGYAIFSADGAELAVFPTREAAYYTARQHELEPFSVH